MTGLGIRQIGTHIIDGGLIRNPFAAVGAVADRVFKPGPPHPYAHPAASIKINPRLEEDFPAGSPRSEAQHS